MTQPIVSRPRWGLAVIGLAMILAGALLASMVQTSGGIRVADTRFRGADGTLMSALLYVPASASAATPAPGILAVHGYINSRETQDGFAIEFARRGYVVLAIDQTGHGYSGGKAFSNGFGGPDGLRYLRGLPFVDRDNIGLEGHSMGGWTVLAAAAAMPDAYRAMVLAGSSTGAPFAKEGSPAWPRNLGLVYSRFDEFAQFMWGERADAVEGSAKLRTLFGTGDPVVSGRLYGSVEAGDARLLTRPVTTHPGDHFSTAAIGDATDWFARTLRGGTPRARSDQIWYWKEVGTGIALLGFVPLVLGVVQLLLAMPVFAGLRGTPVAAVERRDARWWRTAALAAALPALTFFPAFIAITLLVPVNAVLPQTVTTQVAFWGLIGAGLSWLMGRRHAMPAATADWARTIALALATTLIAYATLAVVQAVLLVDPRLWVVAVKPPSLRQWGIALIYVVPVTLGFAATARLLGGRLTVAGDGTVARYASAMLILSGGFVVLLKLVYGIFFATGTLVTGFDPLSTVIAIQFVPVLAAVAAVMTFAQKRTGDWRAGAVLSGLLVTLYVVAGTATQG